MHDITLLRDIGLGIIFAVVAAHVARVFRQPLILGYIVGGILLSGQLGFGLVTDEASIELISEIGLILLLFIIGLEINLRELARLGKSMFILGISQFLINTGIGILFFMQIGYHIGGGDFDLLYLAIVMSLSSTLIVVKLLRDKFELKSVSGRLTLGVLIFQDVWAILFMALQPNLADPGLLGIARSVGGGILLIVVAFAASRFILSRLFEASARRPELVLLSSVAWCFIVAGGAEFLGLSREMGALIAGMSISVFPYGADVISKITGLRDFFVTLFFVSLGMKVPLPTLDVLGQSMLIVLFVFASRFMSIVPMVYALKDGLRVGIITALNLSQISEFSLVILALGVGYGHVGGDLSSLVLTSMIITSLLSTYIIQYNGNIARFMVNILTRIGIRENDVIRHDQVPHIHDREILLLGHFRIAQAVLDLVEQRAPQLKDRITLVDYHAQRGKGVLDRGFHWEYGDLAHPDSLEHVGIENARLIVVTISDTFLKGIDSRRLLANIRRLAPSARVVMVGEEKIDQDELMQRGADEVLIPGEITGEKILGLLLALDDTENDHRASE
ncbi:MAG: cation:proton antiporter [Bacteroidota bacterium]